MSSRPWMAERVDLFRTLRAPFLTFFAVLLALLAIPNPIAMLASGGSYSPLVSLFLTGIKLDIVPAGWTLLSGSPNGSFEVYAGASIMLALLISSPIISYQVFRLIAPALVSKRTLYSLVALATALLAIGALFGVFFLADFDLYSTFFYGGVGIAPYLDAASFYFLVFRAIGASAVVFTLPVYIYALIRLR